MWFKKKKKGKGEYLKLENVELNAEIASLAVIVSCVYTCVYELGKNTIVFSCVSFRDASVQSGEGFA